jgi:ribonuclease-3
VTKGKPGLPQTGAAALFHESSGHKRLMSVLSYQFKDKSLLYTALTHPSAGLHNNQRLEFLGDAVLQLAISQALFVRRGESEGKLTFRRQRLVNEQTLAKIARGINLGSHLVLSKAFAEEGGAGLDSVLADAMEALIAAVYLDGGFDAAMNLVNRLWASGILHAEAELDAKGALQAHFQALGEGEIEYQEQSVEGPPHRRRFSMGVYHNGRLLATGSGSTKRSAQQQAAQAALDALAREEERT